MYKRQVLIDVPKDITGQLYEFTPATKALDEAQQAAMHLPISKKPVEIKDVYKRQIQRDLMIQAT